MVASALINLPQKAEVTSDKTSSLATVFDKKILISSSMPANFDRAKFEQYYKEAYKTKIRQFPNDA